MLLHMVYMAGMQIDSRQKYQHYLCTVMENGFCRVQYNLNEESLIVKNTWLFFLRRKNAVEEIFGFSVRALTLSNFTVISHKSCVFSTLLIIKLPVLCDLQHYH